MLSKSLIQFSVDKWGCVPFLLFTWGQTVVEVMKIMATSFRRSHACTATLSAPTLHQATANPCLFLRLLDTHRQVWNSLLWGQLLSSGSWCTQGFVCTLQESVSLVLCKFWWIYGGVNGDLLQEGLCHTQVCCTQSPRPCGSSLLTCTSTGDTQTQFCLCGVSGSWCTQASFELSELLWRVCGLVLNVISPLLLTCWGFSFALGCGVSPQRCSCATQPPLQHCTAEM